MQKSNHIKNSSSLKFLEGIPKSETASLKGQETCYWNYEKTTMIDKQNTDGNI